MKKIFVLLLFSMWLFSCSDDTDEQLKITDSYYVKYAWTVQHKYSNGPFIVSYKNNNGQFIEKSYSSVPSSRYTTEMNDELICGPFTYGDTTEMNITNTFPEILEIYVSKNNSPFALKAMSRDYNLVYTIDF